MILLAAALATSDVEAVYPRTPATGIHHYKYESTETVAGGRTKGYRTEFDLQTLPDAVYAIVRNSSVFDGTWKPVQIDPACHAAMNGDATSLARVRLTPLSPEAAKTLGDSFLATCAPAGVFFPLTDILNVVLIPSAHFRATELRKAGDSLAFAAFDAHLDRTGVKMDESSPGGEIALKSLDYERAVLDWKPSVADLQLIEKSHQVTLSGTEHFAFRVEIDRKTGAIMRADATYDDLDLKVVGAPDSYPHVRISRTVTIMRR